jgi:ABC-type bacteriocin/lantibiotic exporter with double-glycine peptidase domain
MNKVRKDNPLKRLFLMLRPDRKEIRNVYFFAVLSGLMSLSLPLGIQAIISFVQTGQVSASWFVLVFLVVIAIAFSGILNIFQMRITENLQQRIFVKSAFDFADRIPKIKLEELLKKYAPELTNRFFDTLTIQKGISKLLIDFTSTSLQILFGLILLSFYHTFFIFFGFILLLLLVLLMRYTAFSGLRTSMDESKFKYKIAHWLEEIAHSRLSIKMAGNPSFTLFKTDKLLQGYITSRESHFKVLMRQYSYLIAFKVLIATALLLIGGLLVINQNMNIGQFVGAEILILLILSAVEKLILSFEIAYDVLTAIEKIGEVSDLTLERNEGDNKLELKKPMEIELQNLNFKNPIFQNPVLCNFSLTIKAGEKIAVISDSTVSTQVFFSLITGLYSNYSGNILINGLNVNSYPLQTLRDSIGTLMHFDQIITGTIEENICLGRDASNREEINRVATLCGLDKDLQFFPNGLLTEINSDVRFLPKHFIKKIFLARSLFAKPRLMLLEEPLSELNKLDMNELLEVFVNYNEATILFATEKPEIIDVVDKVLVIKNGNLIFNDTPEVFKKNQLPC